MNSLDLWDRLPALAQDGLTFLALLLPALLVGVAVMAGHRPLALVGAMLRRFPFTNALFVLLIAASVGLGVGLIAQERGLRIGTARAAEKFDLVLAAPGSEITMLLAAVYLQPSDVPLLGGDVYAEVTENPHVSIAAPIAFGDSYDGAPVIGTTPDFAGHLAGPLAAGRMFATEREAVAGARVPLAIGDEFTPAHGVGASADEEAHEHAHFTVVGRMPMTGSPWDRAILVPVEAVWEVHGLADGHADGWSGEVGPPFDMARFPGTPAILVRADELWANYALRSEFNRADVMAFFPGAVLAGLHNILGDVRQAMSLLAVATQVLVTAGVLAGLLVLARLTAQRLALLRALGAPARFAFAVVWGYAASLIVAGAILGVGVGYGATIALSAIITERTDILVTARLDWPELHLVAGFVSLTLLLALLPAGATLSRDIVRDLRA
ncbi:ABC transporter permease family protein [Acuticoccus mangrovi]|uniref:ABC transporter permease n=1 Tax=Acuticoccus mangrovi TaxID=2796142 RepID=A0A934IPL5_9HYPH|nr:ABC transporter permease [Acuticoccus mangrovi]MBJ3776258.1 ABC transporter permease [Acuticoccus mangrovi]